MGPQEIRNRVQTVEEKETRKMELCAKLVVAMRVAQQLPRRSRKKKIP